MVMVIMPAHLVGADRHGRGDGIGFRGYVGPTAKMAWSGVMLAGALRGVIAAPAPARSGV